MTSLTVAIAVPLEAEHVAAIRAAHPDTTVLYDPELLPPERFPADHAGDPSFSRSKEQDEKYWSMIEAADVLYGIPQDNASGLLRASANSRLQWVQGTAAGSGSVVKDAQLPGQTLERLRVTTAAGIHAVALAEFALMGILNGFKDTPALAADQAAKHWPIVRSPVRLVSGSKLVIAGLGEIGVETARLAKAMGMRVSGTKRSVEPLPGVDEVTDMTRLPELLADADAFVNTLPATPYTENSLNAEIFAAMKPGGVFVNVGRGTVVDEKDLLAALDSGHLGYAALDVFAVEPLPRHSPLWHHPRVLVSPHAAALTWAENKLIADRFSTNLSKFKSGEPLIHTVDTVHFY